MINHWEEFTAGPTQAPIERLHATLSPRNVILINRNLHSQLGSPKSAVLLFDKVNGIIGIRPETLGRAHAFQIQKKSGNFIIHATPFCRHHNIKVDRQTQFYDPQIDPDGVLRLELHKTIEISRRPKIHRATN